MLSEDYRKEGYDKAAAEYKEKMLEDKFVDQYAEGYKDGFRDGYKAAMKSLEQTIIKNAEEQGVEPFPGLGWWPWKR